VVAAAAAAVIYDHSSCSAPHPAEPTANDITQIKTLLHAFRITIAIMAIAARQRWQLALPTTRSSCGVCSQHPPTSLNLIVSAHILAIRQPCVHLGALKMQDVKTQFMEPRATIAVLTGCSVSSYLKWQRKLHKHYLDLGMW